MFSRAAAAGIVRVVEIADHPDEWERAVAIARARPAVARCTLGLHPYYANLYDEAFLPKLRAALSNAHEAVAIGEIGLDYAKAEVAHDIQRRAFAALASAGRDWGVPLVIHCRDAYPDLISMLKDLFPKKCGADRFWGVIHCFTGTPEDAAVCSDMGFALGADGPVTYKKNEALREGFRRAGLDTVVLETDCPYLPPQSSRGKRNEPAAIVEIAAKLAEVFGVPLEEISRRTNANAAALYRWP